MRIVDLIERNAVLYRDEPAVHVLGGTSVTHGELAQRARGLAAGLAARGVRRGDRIALLAGNGLVYFDVYLAAAYLGAAAVPLSTRASTSELEFMIDDAEPTLIVVDDRTAEAAATAAPSLPAVGFGGAEYDALLRCDVPSDIDRRCHPKDVALQVYTSGTTGRPKGVCLSQQALTFNAVTIALAQHLTHDDVFLTSTPLYHVATGTRITTMALDGQTHVVMPEFDVDACLAAIDEYGVTSTVLVPTQLRRVVDAPGLANASLTSLRLLVYGAAPSSLPLIREAVAALPCGFYQGYGLTEACTNLTALLPHEHLDAPDERLLSCGRPVVGVSVRLLDDDGETAAPGAIGEIAVKTEKVMTGYWRNPRATNEAIVDGWLRTGDLARQDEAGYLTIVDRAKDMLISGGVNIYPSEIELVLHAHPAVAEAAVVSQRDPEWGEVPIGFVVPRDRARLADGELERWCRERLSRLKVPRTIELVDDLPRTASGKVRKVELRR